MDIRVTGDVEAQYDLPRMNFYGIREGQFVSDVGCPDIFGILMQTGILPS